MCILYTVCSVYCVYILLRRQKKARIDKTIKQNDFCTDLFNQTNFKSFKCTFTTILPKVRHSCPGLLDRSWLALRTSYTPPCLSGFSRVRFRKSFLPGYLCASLLDRIRSSGDNTRVSCRKAERLPGRGVRAVVLHGIELYIRSIVSKTVSVHFSLECSW